MTAITLEAPATRAIRPAGRLAGFDVLLRKELSDWVRGRRALTVGAASMALAVGTTVIPLILRATSPDVPGLTLDPTRNVLGAWNGWNLALLFLLATMSLLSLERDRGTLAWTFTKPVSRTAVLGAKWLAAFAVLAVVAIALPMAAQVVVATVAYGALPDLGMVGAFGLLLLLAPAFFVTLTIGVATVVPTTSGVAGVAFVVVMGPSMAEIWLPAIARWMPTSIHAWAGSVLGGSPSFAEPLVWLVAMAVIAVGAVVAFDRQEL
jgi:ABC-type transport system involved in multi-copper enzyme maturation permease subunit